MRCAQQHFVLGVFSEMVLKTSGERLNTMVVLKTVHKHQPTNKICLLQVI